MSWLQFESNSMWINVMWFLAGAVAIWFAGTRLEHYADSISEKTGLGRAFLGILLLATATSLPEIATSITASLRGNVSMAVHNLLGGVVMQTGVLVLADLVMGRRALTGRAPHFSLLLQGVGLVFILAVALMGMTVSHDVTLRLPLWGTNMTLGMWSIGLLGSYFLMLYMTHRSQGRARWVPAMEDDEAGGFPEPPGPERSERTLTRLGVYFALGSAVVLAGGWFVARSGEALAQQTGLGASFVGFTFVAIATSLPEISISMAAVRSGNNETAFANIFGGNAFDVMLLVVVGFIAGGQTIFQSVSASASFAAALGIFVTCIYLWGLLEREDRTVWRLGWDSVAVLLFVAAGNVVIFLLK